MDNRRDTEAPDPFDARYLAFLETIAQLRPRLHRYCSRMTGSVMDGEDVVQDALFEAYRKLDQYDYAGATAIAVVMLVFSLALLLPINLLQKWSSSRNESEKAAELVSEGVGT
jgi:hypothetical protein